MSEWQFTINDLFSAGNKAALRWTENGIHTGSFMHEEPTGRRVALKGIAIYEILNQKIIQNWIMSDNLVFLAQLGTLSHNKVDMAKKY
jgi:predicted ester cyclase